MVDVECRVFRSPDTSLEEDALFAWLAVGSGAVPELRNSLLVLNCGMGGWPFVMTDGSVAVLLCAEGCSLLWAGAGLALLDLGLE